MTTVYVTSAQVHAARLMVRRLTERGEVPSASLVKIANATGKSLGPTSEKTNPTNRALAHPPRHVRSAHPDRGPSSSSRPL